MSIPYTLTINVRYRDGTKANQFFSRASPDAIAQVKQDLQNLNFPTPAECNISFVYPRCMKATWIATLSSVRITNCSILARDRANGNAGVCCMVQPLYRRLKTLVYQSKSPGMSHFWDSLKPNQLEMCVRIISVPKC